MGKWLSLKLDRECTFFDYALWGCSSEESAVSESARGVVNEHWRADDSQIQQRQ